MLRAKKDAHGIDAKTTLELCSICVRCCGRWTGDTCKVAGEVREDLSHLSDGEAETNLRSKVNTTEGIDGLLNRTFDFVFF